MENFTPMMDHLMKPEEKWEPIPITEGKVTVKIYRHQNKNAPRPMYVAQASHHGEVYRITRGELPEILDEAKKLAKNLASDHRAAARISLRTLSYYRKCERSLNGVPLHVAVAYYNAAHLRPASKRLTVPIVVKEFLSNLEDDETLSAPHIQTRRSHLLQFAGAFQRKPFADLSARDIDRYLKNEKWQRSTRHNVRRSIVALFNYAQRKGHIERHLRTEAEMSEQIRFDTKSPLIYSVAEMRAVLQNAAYEAVPFIVLGAFAGLRFEEMQRLDWSDIRTEDGVIRLSRKITKTSRERLVPIQPNLRAWLAPYRSLRGNLVDSLNISRAMLREKLRGAATAAGLNWIANGLRHSFASYYLALTEDPGKTSLACGHSVDVLQSIYRAITVGGNPITKFLAEDYFEIRPKS